MNPELDRLIKVILKECELSYAASQGPGGQNVNRRETKAIVKWNLWTSSIDALSKERLAYKLKAKLTRNGEIVVYDQSSRHQQTNEQRAKQKLAAIVRKGLERPKRRRPTKPSRSVLQKRADQKKMKSELKSSRKKVKI
ncbi:MAG: aminoacyl-tRNA hydrolase [Bdellovibrionales bacterium]|nr:aminoacyl-tRNA hydrolase [Bdellovibrionales bacterium]